MMKLPSKSRATQVAESIQGVCKDCGQGTLNNRLNPVFDITQNDECDLFVSCLRCGSTHVDVVVL